MYMVAVADNARNFVKAFKASAASDEDFNEVDDDSSTSLKCRGDVRLVVYF